MSENAKTFWRRQQERPVRLFGILALTTLVIAIAANLTVEKISRGPNWSDFLALSAVIIPFTLFILSMIGLVLSMIRWTRPLIVWVMKRWVFCLAATMTLIALFYAEENWRGRRAWEACKQELEAQGLVLDWDKFIPPTVPDERNFFKAPRMTEWFVKRPGLYMTNSLTQELANNKTDSIGGNTNLIATAVDAKDYLARCAQFDPDLELIREALKRPYARIDGDYTVPHELPTPNFVSIRAVGRTLAQKAHCYLLLNRPDKAAEELMFIHDLSRALKGAPSRKPMILVTAMINVAVTGLYVETINEGFRLHAWQEPQLIALQKQLEETDLMSPVFEALRTEPVAVCRTIETIPFDRIFKLRASERRNFGDRLASAIWPRGWTYLNMVYITRLHLTFANASDMTSRTVSPAKYSQASAEVETFFKKPRLYKALAKIAVANFERAWQTTAHHQALVNEALIACALERFHLAHGEYPETLNALVPQFLEKVPHDVINGQPLHYQRKADGKFLLYSVGWNETDDGGMTVKVKERSGQDDFTKGDWTWRCE